MTLPIGWPALAPALPVQPRSFAVVDYVLLDYPERPPNETCFPRGGPFIVTERLVDSYIVLDLLTQRPKVFTLLAFTSSVLPPANVDPAAVAATEAREFVIDRILERAPLHQRQSPAGPQS